MSELPYTRHHVTDEDVAAVVEVLRGPALTQGKTVEAFEAALCEYTGAQFAVAVSSGTAALHLAYLAVMPLIAADWDIEVPALSFVATANAALLACDRSDYQNQAMLRFRDVDPQTGNMMDSAHYDVAVPVHFAGRACDLSRMKASHVIEDACHALGAIDFDGCSRVGSCAHSLATVFSFHPAKHVACGEGGAVTTNDADFAARVRLLRSHGRDSSRGHGMVALGLNYRMSDINAALGLSQLKRLDENVERRFQIARLYTMAFDNWSQEADGRQAPGEVAPRTSAWHLYPIRIEDGRRDEVKATLNAQGIGAQIHYPAIHLQPYYRERFGYKPGDFPNAEAWAAEELSLPLFPEMTDADVVRVVDALKEALR